MKLPNYELSQTKYIAEPTNIKVEHWVKLNFSDTMSTLKLTNYELWQMKNIDSNRSTETQHLMKKEEKTAHEVHFN